MTHRKPQRAAFLTRAIVIPIVFWSALAVAAGVAGVFYVADWVAIAVVAAWALQSASVCVFGLARYRKEQYELSADRIVVYRGGLLSDEELEVHFPKVTHVKWVRPWLWHKLFGVGDVYVEVAGSGAGSIVLRDLADSNEVQAEIRKHMQQAFSMRTDELLHEEGPSTLGILLDAPAKSVWAITAGVFAFGSEFIPLWHEIWKEGLDSVVSVDWLMEHAAWLLLAVPIAAIVIGLMILRCLDLKRRIYRVYNGVIEYHEGFLTRNDAFMPVENLSTSEITRGIVERIANVDNVVLSCQGTGQAVSFLYLSRGPELKAVLDKLIDQVKASPAAAAIATETTDESPGEEAVRQPPPLPRELTCPDLSYRMHVGRCLAPKAAYLLLAPLLLFIWPVLLLFSYNLAMGLIRMLRTTYTLRRSSVEEHFDFIRVEKREFSREKITGVVFRENPFDRMFKTITIQFWSIGAGKEITFRNVRKTDELMAAVRHRFDIASGEPMDSIRSQFSLGRFLCANVPMLVFEGLLLAGVIATAAIAAEAKVALLVIPVLAMPVLRYVWGIYYYRRSTLELHREGMVFRRGIISRVETWANYVNVKDVTTMKIPGHDAGAMRFNVAGERVLGNSAAPVPYGFTMRYVPEILGMDERFDYEILAREDAPASDGVAPIEARKALRNTFVRTLLICIVLFPLIVLLPIILPVALWRAHLVRYRIERGRVLMQTGRLFRRQTSILFSRIDHIQTSQGAINKLLGGGNVVISTAGSTRPELVLRDVVDHENFYRALRDHHRETKTP